MARIDASKRKLERLKEEQKQAYKKGKEEFNKTVTCVYLPRLNATLQSKCVPYRSLR